MIPLGPNRHARVIMSVISFLESDDLRNPDLSS